MKNQSIEQSKLPILKCVYILIWRGHMEGKGCSEDNTEDFMEDGGRLRRILVRMEDIDLIQKIFITGTLWSVTFVIEFNWHIWLCDVLTPSYGIFNITYVLTFKSTSVVSCKISASGAAPSWLYILVMDFFQISSLFGALVSCTMTGPSIACLVWPFLWTTWR